MTEVHIGSLRWAVQVARRSDAPGPNSTLVSVYTDVRPAWCSIEPLRGAVFIANQTLGQDGTHMIIMRWQPELTTFDVVIRTTYNPDRTPLIEIFRITKLTADAGRKRFILAEAMIESTQATNPLDG